MEYNPKEKDIQEIEKECKTLCNYLRCSNSVDKEKIRTLGFDLMTDIGTITEPLLGGDRYYSIDLEYTPLA